MIYESHKGMEKIIPSLHSKYKNYLDQKADRQTDKQTHTFTYQYLWYFKSTISNQDLQEMQKVENILSLDR